jgi:hypothetical protein
VLMNNRGCLRATTSGCLGTEDPITAEEFNSEIMLRPYPDDVVTIYHNRLAYCFVRSGLLEWFRRGVQGVLTLPGCELSVERRGLIETLSNVRHVDFHLSGAVTGRRNARTGELEITRGLTLRRGER